MLKNKISILVVDDEHDICEMVAEILKDEGYNAVIANSYEMAVQILKNQSIKMVDGQAEYSLFRSTGDGTSAGITTTLSAGINSTVTTIGVASVANLPNSGIIIHPTNLGH